MATPTAPTSDKTVYIVVSSGSVSDILNLPPGWESHLLDLDTCDDAAGANAELYRQLLTKYPSEVHGDPLFDDLCDICRRSHVQVARTTTDGRTVCVECDEELTDEELEENNDE